MPLAGETFHQAACRGLLEELGIEAQVPQQPLGPMHKRSLTIPGLYIDNELVQSYRVDGFEGQVGPANVVCAVYSLRGDVWLFVLAPATAACVLRQQLARRLARHVGLRLTFRLDQHWCCHQPESGYALAKG